MMLDRRLGVAVFCLIAALPAAAEVNESVRRPCRPMIERKSRRLSVR